MSQRDTTLLWLGDLLEHLQTCQQQLSWTADGETVQVLTDTMLRDLESCRRLCQQLHRRAELPAAV